MASAERERHPPMELVSQREVSVRLDAVLLAALRPDEVPQVGARLDVRPLALLLVQCRRPLFQEASAQRDAGRLVEVRRVDLGLQPFRLPALLPAEHPEVSGLQVERNVAPQDHRWPLRVLTQAMERVLHLLVVSVVDVALDFQLPEHPARRNRRLQDLSESSDVASLDPMMRLLDEALRLARPLPGAMVLEPLMELLSLSLRRLQEW